MENVQLRIVWIITLEKQIIFNERIFGHIGRDTHSHMLKHSIETGHKPLQVTDYEIIGTGYRKNTMKRKLSEALFIEELRPTLNNILFFIYLLTNIYTGQKHYNNLYIVKT